MDARPVRLDIYRTAIPARRFEHAAASRDVAEAVVVRLELADRTVGWGETLPRDYVTGETLETVPRDIESLLWPAAAGGDSAGKDLPVSDAEGRPITAARCAVEVALYHAWHRRKYPTLDGVAAYMRPFPAVRVSGVLGSADPKRTARRLRLMRCCGLRDFKLKLGLGDDADAENLRLVCRRIGKALARGTCTLRVDVNGAWTADETPGRVADLAARGVCAVEQPVFGPPEALAELAPRCRLPLIADESCVTGADARALLAAPKIWLNLRLSKNGGIWPCWHLARLAAEAGTPFVVGCMVGESAILSAAQRHLLWLAPQPRFVEGNYGRFLLRDDLTRRSVRFGYGGRLRPLTDAGAYWRLDVDPKRLHRYGELLKTLQA